MKKLIVFDPKYKQVKQILRERIQLGIYKEDQPIPSEYQLMQEFGVSRHTILKALSELMGENIIYRIHGKGTFVSSRKKRLKKRVGIIVYHSENIYFSKIIKGAEGYIREKNYNLILCNSLGSFENETGYIERLISEVDGFIISSQYEKDIISEGLQKLIEDGFPFVLVSHTPEIKKIDKIDFVVPDYFTGMYKLVNHLLENDYCNFIFVTVKTGLKRKEIWERINGLKAALKEKGISEKNLRIFTITENDPINGYMEDALNNSTKIFELVKNDGKTCIVCSYDTIAIGIITGLRDRNIKIPETVGITGFDDIRPLSNLGFKLTTVSIPLEEMGRKAAELLIEKIETENTQPKQIILPTTLKIRRTTKLEKKWEEVRI
ncbi:MAG: GntR family transcriptional regulator [Candidatus Omnitrophica bacterium]|nr:GntR family transcriptional regulator [Candidatus Omnitrophota bacterium]